MSNPTTRTSNVKIVPAADFDITCKDCGHKFVWHRPECRAPEGLLMVTICNACGRRLAEGAAARPEDDGWAYWKLITPILYQDTDDNRLPLQDCVRKVLDWKYGQCGLVLFGPTRTGKTRSVFQLLKRLCMAGRRPATFSALGFSHDCSDVFRAGTGTSWVGLLAKRDLLFLDDLGKDKLTDRIESELFGVIEARLSNCLPTIITTNLTGDMMAGKGKTRGIMSKDRAEALVARFREEDFFQRIAFAGKEGAE